MDVIARGWMHLFHGRPLHGFVTDEQEAKEYAATRQHMEAVEVVILAAADHRGAEERCHCGFAGTNVTAEALCGCCGKLVDERSMRWLMEQALANFKRGQ
jgi:hypothetical protein